MNEDDPAGERTGQLTPDAVAIDILGRFVHVPMALAVRESRRVDTDGDLWMSVIESTGQPRALS